MMNESQSRSVHFVHHSSFPDEVLMANIVHPRGRLEKRDGDINLLPKHYLQLSLFAGLKKPPDLDKFPGTLVIRRLRRKEELFRQGEPGWTAFYLLTLEDVLTIRQLQLESAT